MSEFRLRPRVRRSDGTVGAAVAPLLAPDHWAPLENETGVCFATVALEILLRCRSLWRYFAWRTPDGAPFQPKTECLGRLRLLFHAMQRASESTQDLAHAFLSQEIFAQYTTKAYTESPAGEDAVVFLDRLIGACADDMGDGAFYFNIPGDPSIFPMEHAWWLPQGWRSRRPFISPTLALVVAHDPREKTREAPQRTIYAGGLRYDWVGSTQIHSATDTYPAHATAFVRHGDAGHVRHFTGASRRPEYAAFRAHFAFVPGQEMALAYSIYELSAAHFTRGSLYLDGLVRPLLGAAPEPPLGVVYQFSLQETIAKFNLDVTWTHQMRLTCAEGHTTMAPDVPYQDSHLMLDLSDAPTLLPEGRFVFSSREAAEVPLPERCAACGNPVVRVEHLVREPPFGLIVSPVTVVEAPPNLGIGNFEYALMGFCAMRTRTRKLDFHRLDDPEMRTMGCGIPHFHVYRRGPRMEV